MDADFSVELGADDPTLDFPWEAPGTPLRFFDIKSEPELLRFIDEAERYRELHDFLPAINSQSSMFQTAKCDVWTVEELDPSEDIYEGSQKLASYVDLISTTPNLPRIDFPAHERLAKRIVELLGKAPDMSAAAEFFIRRCYFREEAGTESGFYITFYLSGYGGDEAEARQRWGIALKVVQNALLQISLETRRMDTKPLSN
jgi:hypothetical protein